MQKWLLLVLMICMTTTMAIGQTLDQGYIGFVNPLLSGANCNAATLQAAINSVTTNMRTIYLTATDRNKVQCTWNIDQSVTVPSSITLWVPYGSKAVIQNNITLNIEGCLKADDPLWYSGTGVLLGGTMCQADASSWVAPLTTSYVQDGCQHGVSGTMTTTITNCTAWILYGQTEQPQLGRLHHSEPLNITYPSNGQWWLIGRLPQVAAPAGWTCLSNTPYCVKSQAAPHPDIPTGTILLMSVVVTSQITEAITAGPTNPFNSRAVDCDTHGDSTQAIQSAINALPVYSGGVLLLRGRCLITQEIVVNRSGVTIDGMSMSGRFRGDMDLDRSASAAHIMIGANITGSVFRFGQVEGLNSQGNILRNVTIHGGINPDGSDRRYTVGTAAVYIENSDIFSLVNVRFVGIKGRALYVLNSVRSFFADFDITRCGDTNKPSVEIGGDSTTVVQGGFFKGIRIEQGYLAPYLKLGPGSRTMHFDGMGFEVGFTTADTWQTYMDIDGFQRHQFNNIHLNNNQTTGPSIIVRNGQNTFVNISANGNYNGDLFQVLGMGNIFSSITMDAAGGSQTHDTFDIQSDHNLINGLRIQRFAGINLSVGAATFNMINNVVHNASKSYTILDNSNGRNNFANIRADGGSHTGTQVTLAGTDSLVSGDFRSMSTPTIVIEGKGNSGRIESVVINTADVAEGIKITGNNWQILNNRIETVGKDCLHFVDAYPSHVLGNFFFECGILTTNTYRGIFLENTTGVDIASPGVIKDNVFVDSPGKRHLFSIAITSNAGAPRFFDLIIVDNNIKYGGPLQIPPANKRNWVANFVQEYNFSAAATITLPEFAGSFAITPTGVAINSITIQPSGPPLCFRVVVQGTDTVVINSGGIMKLAGNWTGGPNDTLCLQSNGTNWYEVGRIDVTNVTP